VQPREIRPLAAEIPPCRAPTRAASCGHFLRLSPSLHRPIRPPFSPRCCWPGPSGRSGSGHAPVLLATSKPTGRGPTSARRPFPLIVSSCLPSSPSAVIFEVFASPLLARAPGQQARSCGSSVAQLAGALGLLSRMSETGSRCLCPAPGQKHSVCPVVATRAGAARSIGLPYAQPMPGCRFPSGKGSSHAARTSTSS